MRESKESLQLACLEGDYESPSILIGTVAVLPLFFYADCMAVLKKWSDLGDGLPLWFFDGSLDCSPVEVDATGDVYLFKGVFIFLSQDSSHSGYWTALQNV